MSVQRVEALLKKVAAALDAAGVPYAVIGGNAVAAWVASVDEDAVRSTKDVDILLRRGDLDAAATALRPAGLVPAESPGVPMFLDADDPTPKRGVHVILANEPVRDGDLVNAPDPERVARLAAGFRVIDLYELLVMKLAAFRLHDQVHVQDLRELGLITGEMIARLPAALAARYAQIPDKVSR